jgi:hypothetical protein
LVEGGAGLGKTSLVEAACRRAEELGLEVLRSRGSELEAEFAFGVVRRLFELRLAAARLEEQEALLAGPAGAVRPLLLGGRPEGAPDRSFAVLHGLYWLALNLTASGPLLLVVDDPHWADEPSLRWLAYLGSRREGLALAGVAAVRPAEPAAMSTSLLALRPEASTGLAERECGRLDGALRTRRRGYGQALPGNLEDERRQSHVRERAGASGGAR